MIMSTLGLTDTLYSYKLESDIMYSNHWVWGFSIIWFSVICNAKWEKKGGVAIRTASLFLSKAEPMWMTRS